MKMVSLYKLFEEKLKHSDLWSYYGVIPENSLIMDIFIDKGKAYNFIKTYFNIGCKQELLKDSESYYQEFLDERAIHTVSTFFLGLIIADAFEIDMLSRNDDGFSFSYYWFLTCLYHDIGYIYEDNTCENTKRVAYETFDAVKNLCNIKHLDDCIFRTYTKEEVEKYLRHRATCCCEKGSIDHGIIGGLMLYDRLRKQFEKAKKCREPECPEEDFYVKNRNRKIRFTTKHFEDYAKAANAIIRHNIWKNPFESCTGKEYKKISKFDSKDYEENVAFILALADEIEPQKRNMSSNSKYLESIFFEKSENGNGFKIYTSCKYYNKLYRKIDGLSDWVDIKVNVQRNHGEMIEENKQVTIEFDR